MSDVRRIRGVRRWSALAYSAALILFSTVGCSSVPDVPEGAFGPLPGLRPTTDQEAFRQQVENDPFPTAGEAGL